MKGRNKIFNDITSEDVLRDKRKYITALVVKRL